jgi:hypothetical protein
MKAVSARPRSGQPTASGNPVVLIEETQEGGTRASYDTVTSAIAPYDDAAASEVARRLDAEVLGLLREAGAVSVRIPPLSPTSPAW